MLPDSKYDEIVANFYKAASGKLPWNDALVPFKDAFDAWAIYVHGLDMKLGRIEFAHIASDVPPQAELEYLHTYHKIDPRAALTFNAKPGEWFNCWEIFDEDFVARDPFYQEFLIPYGGRYVSGTAVLRQDDTLVMLGVHRGVNSNKLRSDEMQMCQRLARHLSEAIQLHYATIKLKARVRLGAQLLSRLQLPVIVVDAQRKVEQINDAAEALLRRARQMFLKNDSLYMTSPKDDATFLLGLRGLLSSESADTEEQSRFFFKPEPGTTGPLVALYISPLRPAETLHAFSDHAVAMIVLHDENARVELDPYLLNMVYQLTPAESRVATALAQGASVKGIAQQHGVSAHTVRTQIKAVLAKTGAVKQSEVVARLMALPKLRT